MATNPLTAEVSYTDPATKARKRVMVKAGDVLPDGREVLTVEPVPGGGDNVATLRRKPAESTPARTAQPTPTAAVEPPAAPKKTERKGPTAPSVPETPKEAAAAGGEGDVMKQGRVTKARKQTTQRNERKASERTKAPKGKAREGREVKHRITDEKVVELLALAKKDPEKWDRPALAERFGISVGTVANIQRGITHGDAAKNMKKASKK